MYVYVYLALSTHKEMFRFNTPGMPSQSIRHLLMCTTLNMDFKHVIVWVMVDISTDFPVHYPTRVLGTCEEG